MFMKIERMISVKKIILIAMMLVSICVSCFAETWYRSGGIWEFNKETMSNMSLNTVELMVVVRRDDSYGNGNKIMAITLLRPYSESPYLFNVDDSFITNSAGKVIQNTYVPSFVDVDLAKLVYSVAGIKDYNKN